MATFSYKGIHSADGKPAKGLVEAIDLKEARAKLQAQGILTQAIQRSGTTNNAGGRRSGAGFDLAGRALVYRELGALLEAGLPLDSALQLLVDTPELGGAAAKLARVRDLVGEGQSLSDALSETSARVTEFETAVLSVGEQVGTLGRSMDQLADFLEREHAIRDKIRGALVYPALVLGLAVLVAAVMLGVMLPNFEELLERMNVDLPPLTRIVLAVGDIMKWLGPLLLIAAILGFWFVRRSLKSSESFRVAWDRRWFTFPVIGKSLHALVNLRFSRTLSLLIRGGVPLPQGLHMAGRATGSPWVASLVGAEVAKVSAGEPLSDCLRRVPPLAGSLPGWVKAGEASGDLDNLLDHAANRYQTHWDTAVTRNLSLIEPILILLVGGLVLIIALAILLPILSLNTGLR